MYRQEDMGEKRSQYQYQGHTREDRAEEAGSKLGQGDCTWEQDQADR